MVEQLNLSSFHSLFLPKSQQQSFTSQGLAPRLSTQFHWQNRNFTDFDDFLSHMSSKKRKNIKRERRRVAETGIQYNWVSGDQLNHDFADRMYLFYARTVAHYGGQRYLNKDFFYYLVDSFASHTLFLFAYYENQVIAGGLYFKSDDTLYGRYWGALDNFHSVHFETCYYQAIEWCISNGYLRFEAGAQGQHKLARGLEPCETYSCHWISDPQFRDAIEQFLQQEQQQLCGYNDTLKSHSPFKITSKPSA